MRKRQWERTDSLNASRRDDQDEQLGSILLERIAGDFLADLPHAHPRRTPRARTRYSRTFRPTQQRPEPQHGAAPMKGVPPGVTVRARTWVPRVNPERTTAVRRTGGCRRTASLFEMRNIRARVGGRLCKKRAEAEVSVGPALQGTQVLPNGDGVNFSDTRAWR